METEINIDLDEFARIMRDNFGIKKGVEFYRNLAKTGQLETAHKVGTRWKVKVNASFYNKPKKSEEYKYKIYRYKI